MGHSRSKRRRSPDRLTGAKQKWTPARVTTPVKRGRLWFYRFAAIVLIPALFVGAAELGLRLAGYGYYTAYFLEVSGTEEVEVIPNDRFGQRFFPPGLARSPTPMKFSPDKPEGTYRIFLFGESAALGDPRPAFHPGRDPAGTQK